MNTNVRLRSRILAAGLVVTAALCVTAFMAVRHEPWPELLRADLAGGVAVTYPKAFRYATLGVLVLNPPVFPLLLLFYAAVHPEGLGPIMNAVVISVALVLGSVAWWWLVGTAVDWLRKRRGRTG